MNIESETAFKSINNNNHNYPVISIIIPTYNAAYSLQRCLDSVIEQSYQYKELIIMDGGSTDGTVDIIKQNDTVVSYWESTADKGIHNAWNKALNCANGDWIYFLGADDYLCTSQTLERVANYLKNMPEDIKIVYGKVIKLLNNDVVLAIEGKPWHKLRKRFLRVMCLEHQGVFHHQSFFEIYGLFDESYSIAGDYELLLRYLKQHEAMFIDENIAVKYFTGMTANPKNSVKVIKENWRARKNAGIKTISFPLIIRYLKARLRSVVAFFIGADKTQKLVNVCRVSTGKKPMISNDTYLKKTAKKILND